MGLSPHISRKLLHFALSVGLRSVNHVSPLQVQEESVVLAEEHLFHDMEAFDDVEQIDDVQIAPQLLQPPVQVEVVQACLVALERGHFSPTSEASEVIEQSLA